jgi:hypothetical protein
MTWRSIKDDPPPGDGTEFQAWILNAHGVGFWEPRCRFHPEHGIFEFWGRIDYDEDGWDMNAYLIPTHWMPLPEPPDAERLEGRDG